MVHRDYRKAVYTVVHEMRHRYQFLYARYYAGMPESEQYEEAWSYLRNILSQSSSLVIGEEFGLYNIKPIEPDAVTTDAESYADEMTPVILHAVQEGRKKQKTDTPDVEFGIQPERTLEAQL